MCPSIYATHALDCELGWRRGVRWIPQLENRSPRLHGDVRGNVCIPEYVKHSRSIVDNGSDNNIMRTMFLSAIKRIKNYLRSTTSTYRMSLLALLNIHMDVDINKVINTCSFDSRKCRKLNFFLKRVWSAFVTESVSIVWVQRRFGFIV